MGHWFFYRLELDSQREIQAEVIGLGNVAVGFGLRVRRAVPGKGDIQVKPAGQFEVEGGDAVVDDAAGFLADDIGRVADLQLDAAGYLPVKVASQLERGGGVLRGVAGLNSIEPGELVGRTAVDQPLQTGPVNEVIAGADTD